MVAGVVAAVGLAACGRGDIAPVDLGHELDVATGDTSGLLPNRGGTQFVSAIERTPGSKPAVSAPVKRPTPTPKAEKQPVEAPVKVKEPQAEAEAVAVVPAPAPAATAAPTPTPTPTPTPRRKGGYATMGDIMRNAPFPINPVDTKR
jgi:outer membrane biosynthesis protein TonB